VGNFEIAESIESLISTLILKAFSAILPGKSEPGHIPVVGFPWRALKNRSPFFLEQNDAERIEPRRSQIQHWF
jgi:hypothetical protein